MKRLDHEKLFALAIKFVDESPYSSVASRQTPEERAEAIMYQEQLFFDAFADNPELLNITLSI